MDTSTRGRSRPRPVAGRARGNEHHPAGLPVPQLLSDLAGWTWRLLLLFAAAVLALWVARTLSLVSLPIAAALLLTALLSPVVGVLRRFVHRAVAVAATVVLALGVVGGLMTWAVHRAISQWPALYTQVQSTVAGLHISNKTLESLRTQAVSALADNRAQLTTEAFNGLATAAVLLTGVVLTVLLMIILLADGDRMWRWLVDRLPAGGRVRADAAGRAAWERLSGWIRGTFVVAAFHGVVIGVSLALLSVPLIMPLAVMVFFGSFIPLFGAVIFGGLAVLLTLATQGLVAGLVLLGVLLVGNQIEAHVLQPFLVGRYVRLHPFVVAVVITAGGLLWGVAGALLAIPATAAGYAAATQLRADPADGATAAG